MTAPYWPLKCRHCGNPFLARNHQEQVCSDACRLWRKVDVRAPDECWPWTGFVARDGYARAKWPNGKLYYPHRLAVEVDGRLIPAGMVVDHICRNRRCCNPVHLRIVTPRTNTVENSGSPSAKNSQKVECVRGHAFSGDNLAIQIRRGREKRRCRECARIYQRREVVNA